MDKNHDEPATELPPSFTISESVNGVVSLVKDHPSLILPEEVTAVEEAVKQHPEARRYRTSIKQDQIKIYEQVGPNYDTLLSELQPSGWFDPSLAERLNPRRNAMLNTPRCCVSFFSIQHDDYSAYSGCAIWAVSTIGCN
jgi:hypothetical protein